MPFTSKTVFMECKVEGEITLFSYYVESNTQIESTYHHYYFIESKYSENTDEVRQRKILRKDFERIAESFTEDCPKLRNKIGTAWDYSNLDRIVMDYNECIASYKNPICCDECNYEQERIIQEKRKLQKERELIQFKKSKKPNSKN